MQCTVIRMGREQYTTVEAAKRIGVSRQTLQAWCKGRFIDAPEPIEIGNMSVRLWTKADIQRAKRFKGTLRRGPVPRRTTRRRNV
jgi:DNA-binding XRE family transcriptional regulator